MALDAAATSGSDGDGSGVVGEGEREGQGRRASVSGSSGERWGCVPGRQLDEGSGEAAGSCVARMLCLPSSSCLPVLASGSSSLAQEVGWASRWAC